MAETSETSWAFVTPSYSGDYRRCLLLCRSMDALLTGNWTHYVIVDRPHYEMFKHLEGARRHVLLTEDVLPGKMRLLFHLPFGGRSIWWSKSAGLSSGWHFQQMVKIGMASKVSDEGLAYCDSDTFFLKQFDVNTLTRDGQFRLLRSHAASEQSQASNPTFVRASLEMLELPQDQKYYTYVDNFVTWRRKSALALQDRLGRRYDGEWRKSFRNRIHVSEYNLYGIYVDSEEREATSHFHTSEHLCKTHWSKDGLTPEQIQQFCESLAPWEVMVGIQSFAKIDIGLLEQQFELALKKTRSA